MHPELLNNSLFLRYYGQWQRDPASIVFIPIADFFLRYGMIDEAMEICRQGVKTHPYLLSGHLMMTKVHISRGELEAASESVRIALSIVPDHETALKLSEEIEKGISGKTAGASVPPTDEMPIQEQHPKNVRVPSWETVTMANIYSAQGHYDRAREIYQAILNREPDNEDARRGLEFLSGASEQV